jgi:hypothetical protein
MMAERSNPYNRNKYFEKGRADASNKRKFKVGSEAVWAVQEYAEGFYSNSKPNAGIVLSMLDLY